jgi:hypothetical protein
MPYAPNWEIQERERERIYEDRISKKAIVPVGV